MPSGSGTPTTPTAPQTSFVTGLAWSFIGLAGVSLLLAVIQYVLVAHVLPMNDMRAALLDAIKMNLLPPLAMTVFENMRGITVVLAAASLLTLLVSIGLLYRQNWARLAFAWIMIAAAAAHVAGALLPVYYLHDFSLAADAMPPELRGVVAAVTKILTGFSIVMCIAFAGFFAWIAQRLLSADIRREFAAAPGAFT